jgi:hypothetical protein
MADKKPNSLHRYTICLAKASMLVNKNSHNYNQILLTDLFLYYTIRKGF